MAEATKKATPKAKEKSDGVELPGEGGPDPRIAELEARLVEQAAQAKEVEARLVEQLESTEGANQDLLRDLKKKDSGQSVAVTGELFRPEVGNKTFRIVPSGQNAAEAGLTSLEISGVPDESEAIRQYCEKHRIKSSSYVFRAMKI